VRTRLEAEAIVVGAGPTGLMLASELALAGVRTVVLERLPQRSVQSKGGGVQPRTAEILDLRGLMEPLLRGAVPQDGVGGHFGGLPVPLDCAPWNTRHPHPVLVSQARIEEVLEERLAGRGIAPLRGCEVTAVEQDPDGVTASAACEGATREVRGRYLVACDGGHSTVRKLFGVPFPGRAGTTSAVVADVRLAAASPLVPARAGHFSSMVRDGSGYWSMLHPLDAGLYRFVFGSRAGEGPPRPRDTPVTEEEVRTALEAVYGVETRLQEVCSASRFTDATRQVERYREGRVLFAGDAAHIHLPLGGQGLNLGLQDAFNLGWKLAAELRGWAPGGLLDTYHSERHPVAARVLHHTRAQRVLAGRTADEDVAALRDILTDLVRLPEANRHLAGMMAGLDLCHTMPDAPDHPLLGRRIPDVDLATDAGPVRLSSLTHSGRGLLLDLSAATDLVAPARAWSARVDHLRAAAVEDLGAAAVLLRPDGQVCWACAPAADGGLPPGAAEQVRGPLARWFGAESP
jgi:2-polyprenyl-6-methoxyphenol hydroxylase-like FAD-dependent oxidoreductase